MTALGPANLSPTVVVDPAGRGVADPSGFLLDGLHLLRSDRLLWALPMGQSGLQRYLPNHPPAENCNFGMDFSFIVPFGVGLKSGTLAIFTNTAVPSPSADWTIGPVEVRGRSVYAPLTGGVVGTDYQLQWTVTDSQGYVWPRTALVLCAQTS